MRYVFHKVPTEHAHEETTQSNILHNTHLYPTKHPFKMAISRCFKAKTVFLDFFLSLSLSVKAISVFLKSLGVIWGKNFSSVFFHSGSTSFSLFLSSECRKPLCQREFTFSHTETFNWSARK